MNIDLRSKILESSLNIENLLNEILLVLLGVKKEDSNTLGNKGSALSAKSKADILYDLDRLSKEQYKGLILFLEIRNQFIHNIQSESFVIVFSQTKLKEKRNNFLKYLDSLPDDFENSDNSIKEIYLNQSFHQLLLNLHTDLLEIFKAIIVEHQEKRESEARYLLSKKNNEISRFLAEVMEETIDELLDTSDKATNKYLKDEGLEYDFKVLRGIKGIYKLIVRKKLKERFPDLKLDE